MDRKIEIGLSHEKLHVIAMILMVIDHIGLLLFPSEIWLRAIGRLAFPIFCFMIVEGYFHTRNYKKYASRLLISALVSEIPFDYMSYGNWIGIYQNVMWTLLIGLICIIILEKIKEIESLSAFLLILNMIVIALGYTVGQLLIVDYYGVGVLQILAFYYFRGDKWYKRLLQFISLVYLNCNMLGGYLVDFIGFEIPLQSFALLGLCFIWLYNDKKELSGKKSKIFKSICYGFYPIHMIVIYLIYKLMTR